MPHADLLIHADWLLTGQPDDPPLERHSLAARDGEIVAIAPRVDFDGWQADREHDLTGHGLIPGLINAHGHAAMSLLRGAARDAPVQQWLAEQIWPLEAALVDADFVRDGVRLAMAEMIRAGITGFADMYFFPEITAAEAAAAGMRAQVAGPVIEFANAWSASAEAGLEQTLALAGHWADHSRVHIALGPHSPYALSAAALDRVRDLSAGHDLPVHMHLHENAEEVDAARARVGSGWVQYLAQRDFLGPRLQAVHMTQLDAADVERVAASGTRVVHCPHSNLKLASGVCPVGALRTAGVDVALGTDGAVSSDSLDVLGEARLAALLAKLDQGDAGALPAPEALALASVAGATVLGWGDHCGSLQVGRRADAVAVDLREAGQQPGLDAHAALIHTAAASCVRWVWVDGQPLLVEGELTTLDEPAILACARYWRDRVRQHRST